MNTFYCDKMNNFYYFIDADGDYYAKLDFDRYKYVKNIDFFINEINNADREINRLSLLKESYKKSVIENCNDANHLLGVLSSNSTYDDFIKNGVDSIKYQIEQVRHIFFNEQNRKFKNVYFIGIGRNEIYNSAILYMFFYHDKYFSIYIPSGFQKPSMNPGMSIDYYMKIHLILHGSKTSEEKIFCSSHSILDVRKKLEDEINNEFADLM